MTVSELKKKCEQLEQKGYSEYTIVLLNNDIPNDYGEYYPDDLRILLISTNDNISTLKWV